MQREAHIPVSPAHGGEEMLPAGSFILPGAGVLSLRGGERGDDPVELLNRLSTNLLAGLPDRAPRKSILTTEKGKIVDLVDVIRIGGETLVVASNAPAAAGWLRRYIIMEDIEVNDVTGSYVIAYLAGSEALAQVTSHPPSPGFHGPVESFAFPDDLWPYPVVKFIGARSFLEALKIETIPPDTMELCRIASGVPAYGKELSDRVNPLEAGLRRYVSFSKGCYIGQEVIARIDTYDKQQHEIIGTITEGEVSAGETIFSGGAASGWVTSAARSPRSGKYHALGYVRSGTSADLRIGGMPSLRVQLPRIGVSGREAN